MDDEKKAVIRPVLLPVTVLKSTGEAAFVEWTYKAGLHRATIPAKAVQDGKADLAMLEAGIVYGVAWENVDFNQPSSVHLANALRQAGIWTKADLFAHPQTAVGVLQAIYQVDLGELVKFTDKEK